MSFVSGKLYDTLRKHEWKGKSHLDFTDQTIDPDNLLRNTVLNKLFFSDMSVSSMVNLDKFRY